MGSNSIFSFIRLVDYYVQRTYFQIMKNSMVYLMLEMNERVQFVPDEFFIPVPYLDDLEELISRHEKHVRKIQNVQFFKIPFETVIFILFLII